MKNAMILLALTALLAFPADAQRTLAPALRDVAAGWPAQVHDVLAEAGFASDATILPDMDALHGARPYPMIQYDTTWIYGGYPDSTLVALRVHTYPGPDMRVTTVYTPEEKAWRAVSRLETVTDALGRVTEVTAFDARDGKDLFEPSVRLRAYPRGFSAAACDSVTVDRWSAGSGSYSSVFRSEYVFDAHGRLMEARTTLGGSAVFRDAMTYGAQERLVSRETSRDAGQGSFQTERETFVYEGGRLLSATVFLPDSHGGWARSTRREFAHLPEARQRSVIALRWDGAVRDWVVRQVEHVTYNTADRVTEAVVMAVDDRGNRSRKRATFAYGHAGQLVASSTYAWVESEKAWRKDGAARHGEAIPFAASDGMAHNLEALFLRPNPTKGAVQLLLDGVTNAVFVYTLAGQLVERYTLPPGQKVLDLSSLPSGTYQVRARSDEEYYSGQLLIQ